MYNEPISGTIQQHRNGERIASGFVESAVNQAMSERMVKKQQVGGSPHGAHLLLQVRTRVRDEQWENTFRRWYPAFRPEIGTLPLMTRMFLRAQ